MERPVIGNPDGLPTVIAQALLVSLGERGMEVRKIEGGDKPSIIGRERVLIDKLTEAMHGAARKRYDYTPIRETRRGSRFDVAIDSDGDRYVASVMVELEGLEERDGEG